jgi:hypothetical protein
MHFAGAQFAPHFIAETNSSSIRTCQPDDSSVSCLMLRMRANVLSASGSDPAFIEVSAFPNVVILCMI